MKKFLIRPIPRPICGYLNCKNVANSQIVVSLEFPISSTESSIGDFCYRHAQIERRRLQQEYTATLSR